MDAIFNEEMPRARLAVLLKHFSQIDDDREPWRVVHPLAEVLLLLTCATIAACDDFEGSGPAQRAREDHQVAIADKIVEHRADYLLAIEGNQPTLEAEVAELLAFRSGERSRQQDRCRERARPRRNADLHRFVQGRLDRIRQELSRRAALHPHQDPPQGRLLIEYPDRSTTFDTRLYISSAPLDIDRLANAAHGHWGVESMHRLLDVEFKDDLSRYRSDRGAQNMAIVRCFALGLVRANKSKRSAKTRRKTAGWNPDRLLKLLQLK